MMAGECYVVKASFTAGELVYMFIFQGYSVFAYSTCMKALCLHNQ